MNIGGSLTADRALLACSSPLFFVNSCSLLDVARVHSDWRFADATSFAKDHDMALDFELGCQ